MKVYIVSLLLLIPIVSKAQIQGSVIDSDTNEPISYVNIWIEGETVGTTSNEEGQFQFDKDCKSKTIVFSAIGYETKRVECSALPKIITLKPQELTLDEVVLNAQKETKELVVGKFKRSKINKFFGCGEKPKIWARFFPYSDAYEETPYLKKIKVFSMSNTKNAKFNIRFYSIDSLGKPDKYLYSKNVIAVAKKGNKITEIDVSDLDISIPESGLFVAFEWLIIEHNKYEYKYKEEGLRKKMTAIGYNPQFGTIAEESNENSWSFTEGKWKKVPEDLFGDLNDQEAKRYSLLAVALTLSN